MNAARKIERVKSREVADVLGFSVRKVQSLAEQGKIPGAARLGGGCWTFDLATVRDWIRREEAQACQPISTSAAKHTGDGSRLMGPSIDEAYEQLFSRKRRNGSRS